MKQTLITSDFINKHRASCTCATWRVSVGPHNQENLKNLRSNKLCHEPLSLCPRRYHSLSFNHASHYTSLPLRLSFITYNFGPFFPIFLCLWQLGLEQQIESKGSSVFCLLFLPFSLLFCANPLRFCLTASLIVFVPSERL